MLAEWGGQSLYSADPNMCAWYVGLCLAIFVGTIMFVTRKLLKPLNFFVLKETIRFYMS